MKKLILLSVSLMVLALAGCGDAAVNTTEIELSPVPFEESRAHNCATDVQICEDGTILNRQGLQCAFPSCPGA